MSSKIPIATTGKTPFSIQNPFEDGTWSLYIHVPFCTKKCPYCHFFVVQETSSNSKEFKNTLLEEWHLRKDPFLEKPCRSIYLGGGTPSLLPIEDLKDILTTIRSEISPSEDFELTLEVNPESYTREKALSWKALGINRLSIGVQSFSDPLLKTLGRTHSSQLAIDVIEELSSIGFENISIDLMLETPHQTQKDIEITLSILKNLPITHLSLYNMTFEEGSLFYRKQKALKPFVPPDEINLAIWNKVANFLIEHGFTRYEISAFCKPGKKSLHNTGYWLSRPFLGLGPSAFSFIDGVRIQNIPHLAAWQKMVYEKKIPCSLIDEIPQSDRYKEQFLIALRLLEGISLSQWTHTFGDLPFDLSMNLKEAVHLGWLEEVDERLKLTKEGVLFYDSLGALCI